MIRANYPGNLFPNTLRAGKSLEVVRFMKGEWWLMNLIAICNKVTNLVVGVRAINIVCVYLRLLKNWVVWAQRIVIGIMKSSWRPGVGSGATVLQHLQLMTCIMR